MTQRPIDRKRDAGGIMEIGTPDDQSAITAIFPIGDDLYAVKERGIYEVRLADRIDPNRTNIAMPNTQQRVLNYGSDAPVVGRTLLTAKELFNPNAQKGGGVALPAVGNIAARCNDFVQKADHSLQSLLGKRYGASDPFSQYLLAVLPFLKFIRNARNCVEHPKDSQRIVARDFFPQADGTILPPTIEIIHPHASMPATPVSEFMSRVQEELVAIVEQTIAFMCSKHVRPPTAAFPVQIVEWPEENRWQKHVRYSYGLYDANGRPIRSS